MTTSIGGGVSLSGIAEGDTILTVKAGSASKQLPVSVYRNLFPRFTAAELSPVDDASYDVEYSGGTWKSLGGTSLSLEAGEYSLEDSEGFAAGGNIYFALVSKSDAAVFLRTNDFGENKRKTKASLPAGEYTLTFACGKSFSGVVTPIIRKL